MKRTALIDVREYWCRCVKGMKETPIVPSQLLEEINETITKWGQGIYDFEEVRGKGVVVD
jgi:hypothetical protein